VVIRELSRQSAEHADGEAHGGDVRWGIDEGARAKSELIGFLLPEQLLQFAVLVHLDEDVAAADEFTFDVDLGNGGPAGEFFDPLADIGVFEDVDVFEFGSGGLKNFDRAIGKSALGEGLGAFHEKHDAVLIDDFFDSAIDVTHGAPLGPLT